MGKISREQVEHTELFVTDVENETGKLQTFALIAALP